MKLVIFKGYPGSGKSTAAHRMFPGTLLLENDMWHRHDGVYDWHGENMPKAVNWCISTARAALQDGMDVVVANTFAKNKFIRPYQLLAREFNASFTVYRCTGNFKNVHGLDEQLVQRFKDSMEDWPGEIVLEPA